jgi:hypothetical protein
VLQNLSKNIRECYRRAEECRRKAKAALNELSKANYLEMALAVSGPQVQGPLSVERIGAYVF